MTEVAVIITTEHSRQQFLSPVCRMQAFRRLGISSNMSSSPARCLITRASGEQNPTMPTRSSLVRAGTSSRSPVTLVQPGKPLAASTVLNKAWPQPATVRSEDSPKSDSLNFPHGLPTIDRGPSDHAYNRSTITERMGKANRTCRKLHSSICLPDFHIGYDY